MVAPREKPKEQLHLTLVTTEAEDLGFLVGVGLTRAACRLVDSLATKNETTRRAQVRDLLAECYAAVKGSGPSPLPVTSGVAFTWSGRLMLAMPVTTDLLAICLLLDDAKEIGKP